jgi:hypothetical protein
MGESYTRGVIAGSLLAAGLTTAACSFEEPEVSATPVPADANIAPTHSFEYGPGGYDEFNGWMRTGRLGLQAYQKADRAAHNRGPGRIAKIEHLPSGHVSRFKLNGGKGEIGLLPLATETGTSFVVVRDGKDFIFATHMHVLYDNPTPHFFGETAERAEVRAYFADPATHVSTASYNNQSGNTVPCEWHAELTPTSADVITDSRYCKPVPASLRHLAAFTQEIFY